MNGDGRALEIDRIVRDVLAQRNPRERAPAAPANEGRATTFNGRVITLRDVEGRVGGNGEVVVPAGAILTPSARDYLRDNGVQLRRHAVDEGASGQAASRWGYAMTVDSPPARAAVDALQRDGLPLEAIAPATRHPVPPPQGGRKTQALGGTGVSPVPAAVDLQQGLETLADPVQAGRLCGAVLFCSEAAVACCLANKVEGIRAAVGWNVTYTTQAVSELGANLLVIEPAGCTLFELRNILRAFCNGQARSCPQRWSRWLSQRERHANR